MLDQNTDRMWYVIGAVIVGAALIFLVNSSFPQLFVSVGGVFEDKVEDVSKTIGDINGNGLIDTKTGIQKRYVSSVTGEFVEPTGIDHTVIPYMAIEGGEIYQFTARNGLHNINMAFYDKDKGYISGFRLAGDNLMNTQTKAPSSAVYASVSARNSSITEADRVKTSSPLSMWIFEKVIK